MSTTDKLADVLRVLVARTEKICDQAYGDSIDAAYASARAALAAYEAEAANANRVMPELERGRQPLTSSQLVELATAVDMPPERVTLCVQAKMDRFARAIEAAHGIGNGAAPAAPAEAVHPEFKRGYEFAFDDIKAAREMELPKVARWSASRCRAWIVFEDGAGEVEFAAAPAAPAPVPLTDEQIKKMRTKCDDDPDDDPDDWPEAWSYRRGVRDAEAAHGITKGGGNG